MGYRKCTDKPIIHLKKKGETIPFDVNTVRTFEYDLTDLDNVEETKKRLEQTIGPFLLRTKLMHWDKMKKTISSFFFKVFLLCCIKFKILLLN